MSRLLPRCYGNGLDADSIEFEKHFETSKLKVCDTLSFTIN